MSAGPTGPPADALPSVRAGALYQVLRAAARLVARGIFRFRLELEGAEHLPRDAEGRALGGWIAAGLPHRRWIDPFLLVLLLPPEPRVVFLGDGRTMSRSALRRLLFRLIGGVVPIWPRGGVRAFAGHVDAARGVLGAGGVFAIFPESGPPSPPGTARRVEPGIGYLAVRTGASVVPIVIGGNDLLYRGRRLILRVLPPMRAAELLDGAMPAEGTPAERAAARRLAAALQERTEAAVAAVHARVDLTSLDEAKRWGWLSDWIS